jgi:hypothetical protein
VRLGRAAGTENAAQHRGLKPTISGMSGTLEPAICIDPHTGREIYAPTGEPIDLVLPVFATALPGDRPAELVDCQPALEAGTRWALLGVLLLVVACALAARRLATRVP